MVKLVVAPADSVGGKIPWAIEYWWYIRAGLGALCQYSRFAANLTTNFNNDLTQAYTFSLHLALRACR